MLTPIKSAQQSSATAGQGRANEVAKVARIAGKVSVEKDTTILKIRT